LFDEIHGIVASPLNEIVKKDVRFKWGITRGF